MRSSTLVKGASLLAVAAVIGLSVAPAEAATPVSQASATAASVTVAGQGTNSGTYTATNDGHGQSTSGSNSPLIRALGGQRAISAGTLAQDAVATVDGTAGASAACSGVAGDGATVIAAGDGTCLSGGDTLALDVASLDLSNLKVVSSPLFAGVDTQLENALKPFQDQLTSALSAGLTQAVNAMGDPALHLDAGAIQSFCTATDSRASGDSQLAGAGAYVTIPTVGRVDLVSLPVHPGPNTHVVTGLDKVASSIETALRQQLTTTLRNQLTAPGSPLAPLDPVLSQLDNGAGSALNQLDPVLDNALGEISDQLAPLQDNLLDITLNEQTHGSDSISVTALDAKVAPVAEQFTGSDLVHLSLGTSTCGPDDRIIPAVHKAAPSKPQTKPQSAPKDVPTVVTAGLADAPTDHGSAGRTALVALLVLGAGGAGISAFRRALRR